MNRQPWIAAGAIAALTALLFSCFAQAEHRPDVAADKARLDTILRTAVDSHQVPNVAAVIVEGDRMVYSNSFGNETDAGGAPPVTIDTIYRVASMTKPVTAVAAMQLVEAGKLSLDEPAAKYLPVIGEAQVLDHLDPTTGEPVFRAPKTPVTIRELFSHTSGFVYERWDADLHVYRTRQLARGVKAADIKEPLMFDPGTKWEYGTSTMWLGRVVEAVSGESLEDYFQRHIFTPLGMKNSSFIVPEEKGSDLVSLHQREPDGTLKEISPNRLPHPTFFDGGSSLTSSARDYGIFMEMILGDGELHGVRILKASSVREMEENQIGGLTLYPFKTTNPAQSVDGELPGHLDKFGLGFAISTHGEPGGRAPGSVAWAGLENTYFWIDPRNHLGAVLMMQILPFLDPAPIAVFRDFEHEIYSPGRP